MDRPKGMATGMRPPSPRRKGAQAMPDDPTYQLDDQIGYQLRVANQIAVELFSSVLDPLFGRGAATTAQFAVLVTALANPGLTQSEMASHVSMDMPTLNGVLRRLEHRGLITVEVSDSDRRRRRIFLSRPGERLAREFRAIGRSVSNRILEPLTPEMRKVLTVALGSFIEAHRPKPDGLQEPTPSRVKQPRLSV